MSHARSRKPFWAVWLCHTLCLWETGKARRRGQGVSPWSRYVPLWGWYLACGLITLNYLAGCGAALGRIVGQQFISPRYAFEVDLPGNAWQVVTGEPSVLTLSHPERAAGMTIEVTCDRGQSAPLEVLARHLFFGFQVREILLQESHVVHGVPALKTVARARLDTREFLVSSYVVQHHSCVYDMVYFASPQDFPQGEPDFERMVSQFRFLN